MKEVRSVFKILTVNLKEGDLYKDLDVDGRTLLKLD
jgi:hypothetical protein